MRNSFSSDSLRFMLIPTKFPLSLISSVSEIKIYLFSFFLSHHHFLSVLDDNAVDVVGVLIS